MALTRANCMPANCYLPDGRQHLYSAYSDMACVYLLCRRKDA